MSEENRESSAWLAIYTLAILLLMAAPWFNDWAVWLKIVTDAGLLVVLGLVLSWTDRHVDRR